MLACARTALSESFAVTSRRLFVARFTAAMVLDPGRSWALLGLVNAGGGLLDPFAMRESGWGECVSPKVSSCVSPTMSLTASPLKAWLPYFGDAPRPGARLGIAGASEYECDSP